MLRFTEASPAFTILLFILLHGIICFVHEYICRRSCRFFCRNRCWALHSLVFTCSALSVIVIALAIIHSRCTSWTLHDQAASQEFRLTVNQPVPAVMTVQT